MEIDRFIQYFYIVEIEIFLLHTGWSPSFGLYLHIRIQNSEIQIRIVSCFQLLQLNVTIQKCKRTYLDSVCDSEN